MCCYRSRLVFNCCFYETDISQCSVATHLRCGGIFSNSNHPGTDSKLTSNISFAMLWCQNYENIKFKLRPPCINMFKFDKVVFRTLFIFTVHGVYMTSSNIDRFSHFFHWQLSSKFAVKVTRDLIILVIFDLK